MWGVGVGLFKLRGIGTISCTISHAASQCRYILLWHGIGICSAAIIGTWYDVSAMLSLIGFKHNDSLTVTVRWCPLSWHCHIVQMGNVTYSVDHAIVYVSLCTRLNKFMARWHSCRLQSNRYCLAQMEWGVDQLSSTVSLTSNDIQCS